MTIPDMTWQEQASCIGRWDIFDHALPTFNEKAAKRLCAECPVLTECRADADRIEPRDLANTADIVWAGEFVTERYRRRGGMYDRRDTKAKPTEHSSCGTRTGYQRHQRLNEQTCLRCRGAEGAYQRTYRDARIRAEMRSTPYALHYGCRSYGCDLRFSNSQGRRLHERSHETAVAS